MTLLFFDGFQDASNMPKPEWNSGLGSVTGRDGSTAGAGSTGGNQTKTATMSASAATCVAGIAFQASALSGATVVPLVFNSGSASPQLVVCANSSGFLELRRTSAAGTLLGTSTGHTPMTPSAWYYVEMKATLTTATSSTVTVRLNGVTVLTVTGVATSSVTGNVTSVGMNIAIGTGSVWFDDMYICDTVDGTATDGQPNNDFLGDIRVQSIFPSAAGDSTQWTPLSGANYTNVDEVPVNTSDYVSDNVTGHRDLYQLSDLTGVVSTVFAIREHLYVAKSDAGSVTVKPVIKESGGTVTVDSAQAPSTGFAIISGSMKKVRPSDSGLWTVSDINALQAGVEVG